MYFIIILLYIYIIYFFILYIFYIIYFIILYIIKLQFKETYQRTIYNIINLYINT